MSATNAPLEPYDAQVPFCGTDDRYYAFISGIGAGKTVAGIIRTLLNVDRWNPGKTGYVIAPTVPSLRNVIVPELEKWGVIDECEFHRTEKRLEFRNGSEVILESADNDRKIERLRGPSIAWFWMDEAATIDKRAWDIMIGRLRDGDYLNAFVTTTPKGHNWVFDRFVDADDCHTIAGVPSHANPHLPDEYEGITDEYEGAFYEQEVLGEFTSFEGLVHPWFKRTEHVVEDVPDGKDAVIYGVDWGFSNPSVILAIYQRDTEWYVVDEVYEPRMTVDDLAAELDSLQRDHGDGRVYCDPAEPANIAALRRAGFDAIEADNAVMPGIQHVTGLQNQVRVHVGCQNLINEFGAYQYRDGGDSDKPQKEMDHAMDALRYALYTCQDATIGAPAGTAHVGPDETEDQRAFRESAIGQAVQEFADINQPR